MADTKMHRLLALAVLLLLLPACAAKSGPIVITGQNGTVITGLNISSTTGPCVQIINSTNITVKNSNIGPCGKSNGTGNAWGVYVSGGSGVAIYDNYIHVEKKAASCGNSHAGVFGVNTSGLTASGNVIAYGEKNMFLWDVQTATITGNYFLNPRGATGCGNPDNLAGHQFQAWADDATPNTNITVSNNYFQSSTAGSFKFPGNVSDSISFGVTNGAIAQGNYVVGGQYVYGCGLIADYKANSAQFTDNILSDNFNCGIGIASGTNHTVSNNKILLLAPSSPSAAGLPVNGGYSPVPCNTISISNNIAYAIQSSGWVQGYYDNGYCTGLTLSGNTFDIGSNHAAYDLLYPMATTNPPPLVPPGPHACVAVSPYSTQTSVPGC